VDLKALLAASDAGLPLTGADAQAAVASLGAASAAAVYVSSVVAAHGALYAFGKRGRERLLCVAYPAGQSPRPARFEGGERQAEAGGCRLLVRLCAAVHANAVELRRQLPFTAPRLLGLGRCIGCGDRLGNATPGHVRAVAGSGVRTVLAQQSLREMERTGRSPEAVLDSATWGVFQSGFREGFGADADHLKAVEDADAALAAGFVMFTVDPGLHVDSRADALSGSALAARFEALPWDALEARAADCLAGHVGRGVPLAAGGSLRLDEQGVMRAAVKYGRAVAHTAAMWRHLKGKAGLRPFELEMSVDETDAPTTPAEHAYVALELRRLGVRVVSLAPRFIGRFEKAVDYRGDLGQFARSLADHAAIARELGPYKLSIHSGSDKFSVFPILSDAAGDLLHVKTAGTSYLEALRVIAAAEPALFREILACALECYEQDRRSYHVSADAAAVPRPEQVPACELPRLLDRDDARQVLHVTYGSVLNAADAGGAEGFRARVMRALDEHEEEYYAALETHLGRHVEPLRMR
jgi:hypothetical protein